MTDITPIVAAKRRAFHDLHQSGCFVIPNPWDVGSARFLQSLGFCPSSAAAHNISATVHGLLAPESAA